MSTPEAPSHPAGTWRIGRVAGVDLLARPSLLVMGVILVVLFAPRYEDQTQTNPYVVAAVFVVALYASILLHEIAHVLAARGFGMHVPSVTLHLLGGETAIEGESRTPWQELATAIVGPIVSLAIGLAAGSGRRRHGPRRAARRRLVDRLGQHPRRRLQHAAGPAARRRSRLQGDRVAAHRARGDRHALRRLDRTRRRGRAS